MTDSEMVGRQLNGDVAAQPQDVSITRFNLGLVLVVRLDMSVRDRVSVVRIRLMDVLRRDGEKGHHPRGKRESDGKTPN